MYKCIHRNDINGILVYPIVYPEVCIMIYNEVIGIVFLTYLSFYQDSSVSCHMSHLCDLDYLLVYTT